MTATIALRVLGLVERPDHVCTRYRLEAFRALWERFQIQLSYRTYPTTWSARWGLGRAVAAADVVVLQRKLPDRRLLDSLRKHARRLIFDFDDAIWMRDSFHPGGLDSAKLSRRFQQIVKVCDAVVAGNDYLAEHARRFTQAPVVVIPTCVDPNRYPTAEHTHTENPCRLVWIGSASTLQGLDRFRVTLERIGLDVPGLTLRLVCDHFLKFQTLAVEAWPWSEASEAEALRTADIGISFVPDDAWSRGKCGLKILQYQAAGLPVVANPVGVHPQLVRPHRTGFLAEEPQEWVDAVRLLARYPSMRRDYGRAGLEQVRQKYSVTVGALQWLELLRQERRPGGPPG